MCVEYFGLFQTLASLFRSLNASHNIPVINACKWNIYGGGGGGEETLYCVLFEFAVYEQLNSNKVLFEYYEKPNTESPCESFRYAIYIFELHSRTSYCKILFNAAFNLLKQ